MRLVHDFTRSHGTLFLLVLCDFSNVAIAFVNCRISAFKHKYTMEAINSKHSRSYLHFDNPTVVALGAYVLFAHTVRVDPVFQEINRNGSYSYVGKRGRTYDTKVPIVGTTEVLPSHDSESEPRDSEDGPWIRVDHGKRLRRGTSQRIAYNNG
jgi:hypothetical protein